MVGCSADIKRRVVGFPVWPKLPELRSKITSKNLL